MNIPAFSEAIFAQDEFIGMLEGDLLVYEAHVGILRDSLGATKKEDRQHIKSKAFAAKLNALEMEKQEMVKRNNGGTLIFWRLLFIKILKNFIVQKDEQNKKARNEKLEFKKYKKFTK